MQEKYINNRPSDQTRFINIAREWRDRVNTAEKNEGLRRQLLEKGVNAVKTHIKDSLRLQFKSWEARVLDIAPDPSAPDYTVASFGMNLDPGNMSEKTRYQSLVFTSRTSESEPTYAALKTVRVGDIIRIDGSFTTMQKTINIDRYNDLSRSQNVLDNPEFRVEIDKVEKI
jgi:hypothetical protein